VPRQEIKHMVEEADTGRNVRDTFAIKINRDLDVGLLGGALDRALRPRLPDFAGGRVALFVMTLRPRAMKIAFCVESRPFIRGSRDSPQARPCV